jgi:hypothetical protein
MFSALFVILLFIAVVMTYFIFHTESFLKIVNDNVPSSPLSLTLSLSRSHKKLIKQQIDRC